MVRKNTYSNAAVAAAAAAAMASTAASRALTSQPARCSAGLPRTRNAADSAIVASVRSDSSGTLLLPMMCRFTE